jgi:hypothetical protein
VWVPLGAAGCRWAGAGLSDPQGSARRVSDSPSSARVRRGRKAAHAGPFWPGGVSRGATPRHLPPPPSRWVWSWRTRTACAGAPAATGRRDCWRGRSWLPCWRGDPFRCPPSHWRCLRTGRWGCHTLRAALLGLRPACLLPRLPRAPYCFQSVPPCPQRDAVEGAADRVPLALRSFLCPLRPHSGWYTANYSNAFRYQKVGGGRRWAWPGPTRARASAPRVTSQADVRAGRPYVTATRARLCTTPRAPVRPRARLAQGLRFGYKQGCAFVNGKCITDGVAVGSPAQFCVADVDLQPSMCTANRQMPQAPCAAVAG